MFREKLMLTIMIAAMCLSQQMLAAPMQRPRYDAKKDAFISTFFVKTQEQIPILENQIEGIKNLTQKELNPKEQKAVAELHGTLDFYKMLKMIWDRDIKGLKKLDPKKLGGITVDILLGEQHFSPDAVAFLGLQDPRFFAGAEIGSTDILPYVFLSSVRDKTLKDKRSTLAMIEMLLSKRDVDLRDIELMQAFLIRRAVGDIEAPGYVGSKPLIFVAIGWSYPEAVEKVVKRIADLYNNKTDQALANYKKQGLDLEAMVGPMLVSDDPAMQQLFKKYRSAFLLSYISKEFRTAKNVSGIKHLDEVDKMLLQGHSVLK